MSSKPVPPTAHSTFVIERAYPASPAQVFRAFSDPAKKRRWMGGDADGFQIESFTMEFAVDGQEHWKFRFQGGPLIATDVCYQEITPDRRLVIVYTMSVDGRRISSSQVTLEFLAHGKGTTLLHTEQGAYFDGQDGGAGREEGTRSLLEQLAKEI